jgi:hypothetical protein
MSHAAERFVSGLTRLHTDPALLALLTAARAPTPKELWDQRVGYVAAECGVAREIVEQQLQREGLACPA